jgi:hypothetical protein
MTAKRIRIIALITSILLFLISLTQKCYCTTNTCGDSLAVLIMGVLGIFYGGAVLTWLANPVLLTAWISVKVGPRVSLVSSLVSFVISLSFMAFNSIVDNEGGGYNAIISYEAGYWLWLSSSFVMFAGNLLAWNKDRKAV